MEKMIASHIIRNNDRYGVWLGRISVPVIIVAFTLVIIIQLNLTQQISQEKMEAMIKMKFFDSTQIIVLETTTMFA